jgi:hypothetical protein
VEVYSDTRRSLVLSFYFSIFLLIMNQFGSVQKMRLYKGREKLYHRWRWCWQSSGTHTNFPWLIPAKGQQL